MSIIAIIAIRMNNRLTDEFFLTFFQIPFIIVWVDSPVTDIAFTSFFTI
ncbi:MAG: hypothetical protein WCG21_10490 [Eubacteriales bacterium]